MGPELAAGFQQAKTRLDAWNDLRARLPQAQERLNQDNYQHRQLEFALDEVEQQLQGLESFSLGGLIDSMLGRKESKLSALREDEARIRGELETATASLTEHDSAVRDIEQRLAALGDPQKAMSAALEQVERAILATEGEAGKELACMLSELDFARARRRELQKAVQIGKHTIERLHNLTNSLGRTRQKLLFGGPLGAVGNVAVNAAARHGMGAMASRAQEGVLEFSRCVAVLDLNSGSELDLEIAKSAETVQQLGAGLEGNYEGKLTCDAGLTRPFMDAVMTAIGHLESKHELVNAEVVGLEKRKVEWIEGSMRLRGEGTAATPGRFDVDRAATSFASFGVDRAALADERVEPLTASPESASGDTHSFEPMDFDPPQNEQF